MSWKQLTVVCALGVAIGGPGMAWAGETALPPGQDLAAEVCAVFAAKCATCHGPELPNPRAGFGYVLDLKRLAADPEKVVPSRPDESGLWQQVHNDEMPPPSSPSGSLTTREKEVIRAWIASGAPAEEAPPSPENETHGAPASSVVWRAVPWVGKLHLLVVHFPIALLVAALVAELWAVRKGRGVPSPSVRFCLGLGAASAVIAVGLGWLFALGGHGPSGLLALHRWIGTTAGALAVTLAVFSEVDARRGVRRWSTRVLLVAGVLLVSITAHFGGLMIHGKDFYDW